MSREHPRAHRRDDGARRDLRSKAIQRAAGRLTGTQTLLRGLLLVWCIDTTTACVGPSCDHEGQAPQRYAGGRTNESRSFYESSSFEGPFLYFPSGRTYRLEHGLSERPADYSVVLSFAEYPLENGAGFAESAGNQAIVEGLTDEYIEVRNDTCAEFFMRLSAWTAPFETVGSDAGP